MGSARLGKHQGLPGAAPLSPHPRQETQRARKCQVLRVFLLFRALSLLTRGSRALAEEMKQFLSRWKRFVGLHPHFNLTATPRFPQQRSVAELEF